MSRAAQHFVDRWPAGGDVDLDVECRRIAMQSLGRSVLGIDLNERADTIANCMHVASSYTADRALRPVRAPRWMPTLARRRARAAVTAMRTITDEMVRACRADPTRDAPLVQALLAASDPETGRPISDDDISNDLLIFMLAGHDTTATALTYSLWVLGHHPDIQDRVAAEAAADRRSGADARRRTRASDTPCRCCTKRFACARPRQASRGWRHATSR